MADLGIARISTGAAAEGTLTRADLADVVHRKLGLSRAESANVVERVLHYMCASLAKGRNVKISGFGNFVVNTKRPRKGRNPQTGDEIIIVGRKVLTFKASQIMKKSLNGMATDAGMPAGTDAAE